MTRSVLIIILCACLGGCVGYRLSRVHGIMSGNAINTPYGPLNGNVSYDAVTCIGNCPAMKNMEIFDGIPSNAVLVR